MKVDRFKVNARKKMFSKPAVLMVVTLVLLAFSLHGWVAFTKGIVFVLIWAVGVTVLALFVYVNRKTLKNIWRDLR